MSTHAPQFRSNLFVALKLTPIMITNVRIDLCLPNRRRVKSPFYPSSKGYKYSRLPFRWHFSCSNSLLHLSPKNKLVPPPSAQPKHPPRVRGFRFKNYPFQQWHPSPRSQRYVSLSHLRLCFLLFLLFLHSYILFPPLFSES